MSGWQCEGSLFVALAVSPDSRYVAALCRDDVEGEKAVGRVWDSETGQLILERPISPRCGNAFRLDSKVLALTQADGSVALCDLVARRVLPGLPAGPMPENLRFHPGGQYLAVSYKTHPDVEVWDVAARKVVRRLRDKRVDGGSLAWSPDGSLLAVGSRDSNIYLWYVWTSPADNIQAVLRGHEHYVTRIEFHPSGRLLASTGHDGTTRLWCYSPGAELVLPGEQLLGFSRDGRRLVTKSFEEITEWELADPGSCLHYLPHGQGASPGPWGIAFAPDGRLLASASQDGVLLWDAAAARLIGPLPSGSGYALAFHPKERCLFTTGSGGVMQWPIVAYTRDPQTGGLMQWPFVFERDGQALLPGSIGPGTVLRATTADSRSLRIDVAGTGDSVLLGAGDGGVDFVPLAEPDRARRLGTHDGLFAVALSPDGRWAASIGRGDTVCVWDVARGILARRFPHGGDHRTRGYGGATFSPDGRWLVTSFRSDFCFWEIGSWEPKARLPGGTRSVFSSVTFARDGRLLALVEDRNRIQLYDAATLPPRRLATLEIPGPASLSGLSLSPDGIRLAATTDHNVIALWDLRLLRQELAALDLDWEMPTYQPAGQAAEPVQALNVEIHGAAKQK